MEERFRPSSVVGPRERAPLIRDATAFLDNLILISAYKQRMGWGG